MRSDWWAFLTGLIIAGSLGIIIANDYTDFNWRWKLANNCDNHQPIAFIHSGKAYEIKCMISNKIELEPQNGS